ncbi:MAG TPA: MarR family transcriptional regulator [Solirubrobacteraceae bacterium]|jgi:DNA-binding MarR family transcriptional regulator
MRRTGQPRTAEPAAEAWALMQELMLGQKRRMFAIASEFELAPMQVMALGRLEPGRPCAMSELAGALRCDNSNVTGIADRLEARGLVERRPGESDRRVKMLHLTEAGADVRSRLWERLNRPPEPLAGLSEEDARTLRDVLARALRPSRD